MRASDFYDYSELALRECCAGCSKECGWLENLEEFDTPECALHLMNDEDVLDKYGRCTQLDPKEFRRGDWVIYDPGYKREIGRVWDMRGDTCFVCYHHGCTPAATPILFLTAHDPVRDFDLVRDESIGFHRFDSECPEYQPEVCCGCK